MNEYEPKAFEGEHVSEVQQSNEALRRKVGHTRYTFVVMVRKCHSAVVSFLRKCRTVVVFLAQIDQLHLDAEQQRVTMNKLLAEAEDRERRLKEASSEEVFFHSLPV